MKVSLRAIRKRFFKQSHSRGFLFSKLGYAFPYSEYNTLTLSRIKQQENLYLYAYIC